MRIGLSARQDIGFNYTIPLNDKEVLVVKEDKTRVRQKSDTEKAQDAQKKELDKKESANKTNPVQTLSTEEERLVIKLQRSFHSRRSNRQRETSHRRGNGARKSERSRFRGRFLR
jgi:hypothetical protein